MIWHGLGGGCSFCFKRFESKALYFPVCIMSPPTLLHLAALMGPPATGDLKISPFDLSWHRGKNKTKRQAGFKTFLTKAIKNSEDKESM